MKHPAAESRLFSLLLSTCLLTASVMVGAEPAEFTATGSDYAVASVHPIATDGAMGVYAEGGNAVDAAICAALTLSVVDNFNSGIGGGCLILIRSPEGELIAIDGREMAPAAASRDMFIRDGKADPELSQVGPLAVATPGALAAYAMALEECGSKPLSRLLQPGLEAARDGFTLNRTYLNRLKSVTKSLRRFPGTKAQLLDAEGNPHPVGYVLKQPDLAKTFEGVAREGTDYFYRGPVAQRVGAWMAENAGVLTADDFAAYEAKKRTPIVSKYRGLTIVGFPPPSSGGVHVAQMLGMLEPFDLAAAFKKDRSNAIHLVAEAMKLAFADRAYWLGDSDFVDVPRGLIDADYIAGLSKKIDPNKSTAVEGQGTPPQWRQDLFGRHTTHIAAADSKGWWVAITATVNTTFGSKVIVPGTGVVLNNEMDDFSAQPGVPNAFGLVGMENNSVAPGKRPLSSMSPTIVLDQTGEPLMTVGAAGGPKIITQVLLAIIGVVDAKLSLADAIAQPRWHHQWRPDELSFEDATPLGDALPLQKKGHTIGTLGSGGVSQGVIRNDDGKLTAVRDPRVPGKAAAR
ncbi:gamma-glutamyltransferase [Botrimarina mediterranea]|uniref:Glutathione hydrolase proenzyme n=1 Tax=Botrimarina mediterranea TaxID=2528022 RepID=A0A518K6Y9_9BACT|nr:gamma-glutamyltransferase [Botrimarina mediterranea]QDV73537.1 Gamma-glutamyltranspeptidase precursor [Botrimarina mediterranea]QDV78128.1 Gamma-glutamyltranspeptidase precursor [Planctomycetes bacterium K2D]